ncbi:hypothetical protein QE369_002799 [Agrobacterium larrymoorei]|uniref:DUF4269 domain-containing protein n=1 Tax=Agrobacterium larrymoorei TaxID=160699 RepID=A0AAJ2BD50_9HYPH|nr:DUF4269 domain-containing protein [Agrobacterium larrymoorei]MDR6102602.1 hypothetical protein [Agrobacterium larrymoorei]
MTQITRPHFEIAVQQLGVLKALRAYNPRVAGTPPLGVETEKSDIDILCHAPDANAFLTDVQNAYGTMSDVRIWQWVSKDRPIIVTFHAHGWDFEIFASPQPVALQNGWRHFEIERRLLALGGENFKKAIKLLRQQGLKTEPAFWSALGEIGDSYRGLLSLEVATDDALQEKLAHLGFGRDNSVSGL